MKKILISILCLFLVFNSLTGQTSEKRQYKATKVSNAPAVDGVLDDEAWKEGTWADEFTQNRPHNGKPSIQRTDFKILFDDDNLYVAIRSFDTSPDSIVNRLTRRDQADGDLVGIIIDSFHDLRTGFLFGVSSSGVKYDQMFTNDGQNQDSSWDPNWWVRTSINKEGWIAEMRIPFSQLRFDKNSGEVWGFDIARIIYRYDEQSFWQHIPRDASEFIHLMGELTGLEGIKPRKILDVTPYGVVKAETFRAEPENPFREKGRKFGLNGGLDAKIGITNNMTMDLTLNPDFGQVEADPSVVNLTAYETFFSEKRPFFIEGNNITNFNIGLGNGDVGNDNLFYSRRIGRAPQGYPDLSTGSYADVPIATRIIGAGKLTGKTKNGLSVGFIEAVTAEEKAKIDTEGERRYETVEPLTNYFVGRVQKDFNEGKTIIGGILTGTNRNLDSNLADFMHKSAYSGGFDFTQYSKNKKWMFNLNAAFSQVNGSRKALDYTQRSSARYFQRPDNDYTKYDTTRTSLTGSGGRMEIQKLNGHLFLLGAVSWKTPGFETNDLGYLREADQIISVIVAGYSLWEPKWIYRNFNVNGDIYLMNNFGGDVTSKGFEWNASTELKNYWNVWTGGNLSGTSLSTGMLRGGPMMKLPGNASARIGFSSDYHKKFTYSIYFNGSNGWEKDSWNLNTGTDLSYKPTNYLSLTVSPSYSKSFSKLQYVTNLTYNNDERYIFGSISRKTISSSLRVNLNLSPNFTIQYWGQPFIASGKYSDFKYITIPMADSYTDRFHAYTSGQLSEGPDNYSIDENTDGSEDYTLNKVDFNIKAFLSNLVLRWEYSPGSTIYLVWSQTRNGYNPTGNLDFFNDFRDLFNPRLYRQDDNYHLNNVFLIKFSYRFGLK
jgi:Domain of unknown function (DUF5916)/Carbohydrate family 9 binding domain-like